MTPVISRTAAAALVLGFASLMAAQQSSVKDAAVAPAPSPAPFLGEKKIALVIGISDYPQESGFPKLQFAAKDAQDLAAVLQNQGYKTVLLTDSHAMRSSIRNALQQVHDELNEGRVGTKPSGTIVFAFSGHGGETGTGASVHQFLVTYDATAQDPEPGYPLKDITGSLNSDGASRVMMFIDACRDQTGSSSKGAPPLSSFSFNLMQAQGIKTLFSTAPGKQSYEDAEAKNGYFTHYLLEGLNGEAADANGLVTFDSLAKWVSQSLQNDQHIDQVPYWNQNASGDFFVAGHLLNKDALVVGVDSYSDHPIQGAIAGAQQVQQKLYSDGFRATFLPDAKSADFKDKLSAFAKDIGPSDVAVFYFAGQGGIASGVPFLMPADAKLPTQAVSGVWTSPPPNAISLVDVLNVVSQNHHGPNIYLLDMGLARASEADKLKLAPLMHDQTLILLCCRPGLDPQRTPDGSLFSKTVVSVLSQPNMTAGYAASKIIAAIFSQTEGVQYAIEVPMLPDRVYLTPSQ